MALTGLKISLEYCNDLQMKLLKNSSKFPFITSDNPLVKYNQFLESKKWPSGWTGFASLGLQMFLPLNSELVLVLYDSWTYRYGDKRMSLIEVTHKDVNQLNTLQILNCETNVFFNHDATEEYIKYLHMLSKKHLKPNQLNSQIFDEFDKNGIIIENKIIATGTINPSINLQLSNCTFTKKAKQYKFDDKLVQVRPKQKKIYKKSDSVEY